ncbi:hypothetical protein M408DRAFT_329992 [Serendipita vermifera MAFF 305830]|uniref:Uncharacterized protein n=1 Tax=Serendipita vermifera MAFF 305830 TaxID=933852 RepID=A0A0C3ASM6_SERVB|nr:hypothetical protein M408DRAFT_329992 [Serendipita vermifera MAFF 305830]
MTTASLSKSMPAAQGGAGFGWFGLFNGARRLTEADLYLWVLRSHQRSYFGGARVGQK